MMAEMKVLSRSRDIPSNFSVFEAGLQWMIDFRKENFRGDKALNLCKKSLETKSIMILADEADQNFNDEYIYLNDEKIGYVQSVYKSEVIGKLIVLAYINTEFSYPGVNCKIGSELINAVTVSAPAFLTKSVTKSLN